MAAIARISLEFFWAGPTYQFTDAGLRTVNMVQLIFDENKISRVHIPQNNAPPLSGRVVPGNLQDRIEPTIAELRSLVVRAIFATNCRLEPAHVIPVEGPDNFEAGEKYCLEVRSHDLNLTARLVKEEPPLTLAQQALLDLLKGPLLDSLRGLMDMLRVVGSAQSEVPEDTVVVAGIEREVRHMDEQAVEELMGALDAIQNQAEEKSEEARNQLLQQYTKTWVATVGLERIRTIAQATLLSLDPEAEEMVRLHVTIFVKMWGKYLE